VTNAARVRGASRRPAAWALHSGGLALALALTGCGAVGPDYARPDTPVPANWHTEPGWQQGQPRDSERKGDWWTVFGDAQLNALATRALARNNTLAAAQSRLDQARAQTAQVSSALLPHVSLQAGSARFQTSADRPLAAYNTPNASVVQSDFNAGLAASYEVDLSGRVHRELENARASEAQSGADFENTRLVLMAQLASNYFSLRELDAETAVVQKILDVQRQTLEFFNNRHALGNASALDVDQQQSVVAGSEAQLQTLIDARARFEHAIATLTGDAAPGFSLAAEPTLPTAPALPLLQPASLLERRPDIASAERAMAATNAQIGIAASAGYPTLMLSSLYGNDTNTLSNLFSLPSLLWSLGVGATQTLFDAGYTSAAVNAAKASYAQATANYRQAVLVAFQDVQDRLSTQAALQSAAASLNRAVQSSAHAQSLSEVRYQAGAANVLERLQAEQTLLGFERQRVQNQGQQLLTTVQLIKAMGGGWKPEATAQTAAVTAAVTGQ